MRQYYAIPIVLFLISSCDDAHTERAEKKSPPEKVRPAAISSESATCPSTEFRVFLDSYMRDKAVRTAFSPATILERAGESGTMKPVPYKTTRELSIGTEIEVTKIDVSEDTAIALVYFYGDESFEYIFKKNSSCWSLYSVYDMAADAY